MKSTKGTRRHKVVTFGAGRILDSNEIIQAPQTPTAPLAPGPIMLWRWHEGAQPHRDGHVLGMGDRTPFPQNPHSPHQLRFQEPPLQRTEARQVCAYADENTIGHIGGHVVGACDITCQIMAANLKEARNSSSLQSQVDKQAWVPRKEKNGRVGGQPTGSRRDTFKGNPMKSVNAPVSYKVWRDQVAARDRGDGHRRGASQKAPSGFIKSPRNKPVPATIQQMTDPGQQGKFATGTKPIIDTGAKKENLLTKLPGELRNRIYELVFNKGDVRIDWLCRKKSFLTYELQQKNGKWKGPISRLHKSRGAAIAERKTRNTPWRYRKPDMDPSTYCQNGGIAALMVCCKAIHQETVPLFYSNFTWSFSSTKTMRTFIDRLSYHALTGIHTVSLQHATHGVPLETNLYGFKRLHDEFFLKFCHNAAQALTNLRSFTICMQVNEPAPLELNLKAAWVQPLLALAHRNLQHAEVQFLAAGRCGHDDPRLKAFADVVTREILGDWPKPRHDGDAQKTRSEARGRVYTKPEEHESLIRVKAMYDSEGYIIGDDEPHRLQTIMPSYDDVDDEYFVDHEPPLREAGMEYLFTSSHGSRFAGHHPE